MNSRVLLINFIRRKRRGRSHLRIAIRFSTTCTWVGLRPHQTLSSSPLKEFEPFVFVAESLRSPPRSLCLVSSTTAWTWRIRAESRWKSFSKKRLIPDLSAESFFSMYPFGLPLLWASTTNVSCVQVSFLGTCVVVMVLSCTFTGVSTYSGGLATF